ncbi:MAG: hypothetical protein N3A58_08470 [Spirochaetes bacterium]|nr:hypothetical protein [Spirochaetota bacterium]
MNIYYIVIIILSFLVVLLFFYIIYITNRNLTNSKDNPNLKNIKRVCPLCGSKLGQNDCVLGDYIVVDGKKKVYIYGCNYCLKGNIHGKRISL